MAARDRAVTGRPARLLGALRLPQRRRPLERRALLVLILLGAAGVVVYVLTRGGDYTAASRRVVQSLPRYPRAVLVSSDASCAPLTTGSGSACGAEWRWRLPTATAEPTIVAWYARHLHGWTRGTCATGFTRGRAYVDVTASGRLIDVYADAHGADHCGDVPAG